MDPLQSIYSTFVQFFNQTMDSIHSFFGPDSVFAYVVRIFHIVLFIIAVLLCFIIAYSLIRIFEIRKKEHEHLHHEIEEYKHLHAHDDEKKYSVSDNRQWVSVLEHVSSLNESDWKLAIMEADNMLDTITTELGFVGDNLGEKLKSTDQEKFKFLSLAWEVHLIRNRIAHEGVAFEVSQHEAKRVISIYEQIFRYYGFI